MAFANAAAGVCAWAAVDDEDLAPAANAGTESMMRAVFRQHFVRANGKSGLGVDAAEQLIAKLLDDDSDSEPDESPGAGLQASTERDAGTLARLCLKRFEAVGWGVASSVEQVTSGLLQNLWSGLGSVLELTVCAAGSSQDRHIIAKLIRPPPDPEDFEEQRDHESYFAEASFYEGGHAEALCRCGARCPLPLFLERCQDGHVNICMTRLPGHFCAHQGDAQVQLALDWLARLHAAYWGSDRADAAVRAGLQRQGCYWHLDTRQKELRRTASRGLEGRLAMAAWALDARLKADAMQTICHGDPKDANMLFTECGEIALYDFQWIGKAPPTKDLAYCLSCAAGSLTTAEEEDYLSFYHCRLTELLAAQGDSCPSLQDLQQSYTLAMCDLSRWMAGWGWWGHVEVLQRHCKMVLGRLDGGSKLASEEDYVSRVFEVFPT